MPPQAARRAAQASRTFRSLALWVILMPAVGTVAALLLWWQGWPPRWHDGVLFLAFYVITLTGIEVGFHRHVAHQAFSCRPWLTRVLVASGSMAFQGPVIWWAATHRRHHGFVDTAGDPHSPHWTARRGTPGLLEGLLHSHAGWLFRAEHTHPEGWSRLAGDLYCRPGLLAFQLNYLVWPLLGLLLPAVLGGLLDMSWRGALMGFLWGGCVRLLAVNHVYWSINSLCHMRPSPRFARRTGHSRNIPALCLLTLGQSWHHNHHRQPRSACMGHRWWQLDPGAWMISAWKQLGWVEHIHSMKPDTFPEAYAENPIAD